MTLSGLQLQYREPSQALAVAYLVAPEAFPALPPMKGQIRIKLVRLPSFGPFSVWAMGIGNEVAHVRRIQWDHGKTEFSPAMGAQAELSRDTAGGLMQEFAELRLPTMAARSAFGLEGVSHGVVFGDAWTSSEFSWWNQAPEEWQELGSWYEKAVGIFEEILSGCRLQSAD